MPQKKTLQHRQNFTLDSIRRWEEASKLSDLERAAVIENASAMVDTITRLGKDRTALAKVLITLRDILKPKRLWDPFLKLDCCVQFGISKATAHRIIHAYTQARLIKPFPEGRMALLAPGKTIKGPEILPPVKSRSKGRWRGELDEDTAVRECWSYFRRRFDSLPSKIKGKALRALIGMEMNYIGIGNETAFKPIAIPEDWKPRPLGRPKDNKDIA